jgi:hypothetical protein
MTIHDPSALDFLHEQSAGALQFDSAAEAVLARSYENIRAANDKNASDYAPLRAFYAAIECLTWAAVNRIRNKDGLALDFVADAITDKEYKRTAHDVLGDAVPVVNNDAECLLGNLEQIELLGRNVKRLAASGTRNSEKVAIVGKWDAAFRDDISGNLKDLQKAFVGWEESLETYLEGNRNNIGVETSALLQAARDIAEFAAEKTEQVKNRNTARQIY